MGWTSNWAKTPSGYHTPPGSRTFPMTCFPLTRGFWRQEMQRKIDLPGGCWLRILLCTHSFACWYWIGLDNNNNNNNNNNASISIALNKLFSIALIPVQTNMSSGKCLQRNGRRANVSWQTVSDKMYTVSQISYTFQQCKNFEIG